MRAILLNTLRYWLDRMTTDGIDVRLADADLQAMIRAIETAATWQDSELWSTAMTLTLHLETAMQRHGTWEEWDRFAQAMIACAQVREDRENEGRLLILRGYIGLNHRNPSMSIACYRQAARIFKALHQERYLATAYSNLGYLTMNLGLYWRADILNQAAIALFERLGDTRRTAYTENHLGLSYREQRRWDEAAFHLSRARDLMAEAGDDRGLAMVLHSLGALDVQVNRFEAASEHLNQARDIYSRLGDEFRSTLVLLDVGNALRRQGKLVEAEAVYTEAETAREAAGDVMNLARIRHNLGMTYTLLENWTEGERCFQRALEYWRAEKDDQNCANTLCELAELYSASGQICQARSVLAQATWLVEGRDDGQARRIREQLVSRREALPARQPPSPHPDSE